MLLIQKYVFKYLISHKLCNVPSKAADLFVWLVLFHHFSDQLPFDKLNPELLLQNNSFAVSLNLTLNI